MLTGDQEIRRLTRDHEIRRSWGGLGLHVPVGMIEASQPGSKTGCVEVHEESRRTSGELQVGDHLRQMHRMHDLDSFELHDEAAFDQEVQPELTPEWLTFVFKRNSPFALDAQLRGRQFDDQAFPVDALQQAWSERAVHFDRGANDLLGERVDVSTTPVHAY